MRAALYSRVSTDAQDGDDKTSLEEQTAAMVAYCGKRGYDITDSYQEVGSGSTRKRPEFQRMLADATLGRFDTIVCWKADRLSRGIHPASALMDAVEAFGVKLEAVMDAIDMKTFGLMAAIGKIEIDNLKERSRMGKRGKAKRGGVPSGRNLPFGYRTGDDGEPVIHDLEAKVVERVFSLYAGGVKMPDVSAIMEHETGRSWPDARLHRLLSQTAYMGVWTYGKSRVTKTEQFGRIRTQTPNETIDIPFPPIVDADTFDRVQELKVSRKRYSKRSTKVVYTLQHQIKCHCGSIMGGQTKNDGRNRYYRCRATKELKLSCRPKSYVRADELEALVWQEVTALLKEPAVILAALDDERADDRLDNELADAERELAKVQAEESRLVRWYIAGKLDEKMADHQRRFITERLETARQRVQEVKARQEVRVSRDALADAIGEWVERVGVGLDQLTDQERKDLLALVLDGATLDRDNNLTLGVLVSSPIALPCGPV